MQKRLGADFHTGLSKEYLILFFRARAGGNLRFNAIWLAIGAGSIFLSRDHGQRYPDVISLICFRGCKSSSNKTGARQYTRAVLTI